MIFVWIPKTGGTSFAEKNKLHVVTDTSKEWIWPEKERNKGCDITFGHACPRHLMQRGIINDTDWTAHDIVCLVRDPSTRFISLYRDYLRSGRIPWTLSQREFAHAIYEMRPLPGLFNSQHLSMCAPQVSWILPGMQIIKLEDEGWSMQKLNSKLGSGSYNIDKDALPLIRTIYAVDYITLGYSMP